MSDQFALFPLKTVLLPSCVMDLQIFEARYLDMVSRCFKQDQGFVVVGLESGPETGSGNLKFNSLGCEARIIDWQQQDNGLLGIRVQGHRRARILDVEVASDGLVVGGVDWLEESLDMPPTNEHADMLALRDSLLQHPMAAGLGLSPVAHSQQALAYQLAYLLPFSIDQKAALLAIDSPAARLEQIIDWLQALQS
ncbi:MULTISPECIES: LON peptidase substrate-binding domain-containing protein [Pseudomonas]|uniref:LON peptidase substrate-binding domain-containing protein n=1 Tax=Pseudomonas TaxID=286 RepID=UPI00123A0E36|nr:MULTISPECIES: LON peptidase substrate-binding domain-containing protein [Pseudomonas]QIB52910.1 ATP-dependent protease [Pseudomonas sp. OIL-1]